MKLIKSYIWHIITLAKMKYRLRKLKGVRQMRKRLQKKELSISDQTLNR